ncbi:ATPase, T2SS/T4P/T4SS family [Roseateles sp.]|jgi:type II secretory ATPase GspE/PulE/Tfp pilus assembly ATPase PilB-like protein|uniref:GspE/PulE family protein n=1 Tax=Roseateles sp. TaxID=1971397 RepID=UPI00391DE252
MHDPSAPLNWPYAKAQDPDAAGSAMGGAQFQWPTPPYTAYPQPQPQTAPEPCEILGLNNSRTMGHVVLMAISERLAHINVPPARSAMPLKFSQFRAIKLLRPIPATPPTQLDPADALSLDQRPRNKFRLSYLGGSELEGVTIGHYHDGNGLYLFAPVSDSDDSVQRIFVPREVLAGFELGERLGELLVRDRAASADQIEAAAREQSELRTRRVGDILVAKQVVSSAQLMQAIEQQAKMPMVRIGEALLALELVTQEQLDEALAQQREDRSVPLGQLLVRRGVITRQQLQSALARKMGYPLVDVENFPVEADAVHTLPYAVAKRLEVLPLVLREGKLIVAMEDPTRRDAIDEVEFISQLKVVPTLTKVGTLQFALPQIYDRFGSGSSAGTSSPNDLRIPALTLDFQLDNADKLIESLERDSHESTVRDDDAQVEQSDNSLVRLINTMIIEAHAQGVSDIHIETYPGREKVRIRFRKDGQMQPYLELPHTYRNAMIARIKIMCDLDISERRKPQDGKINFARFSGQHKLELRVATIPTTNGLEDVVMRLLSSARPLPLDKLGLSPANLEALKQAISRPYGMVLCVGPTGSGKTTTLHSALGHINTPDRKIWTAEDPIEITQQGLRQVQVNPKIDWTFAKALRAFLRADPDVIMVGEIRDEETANIAVEASLTGHLVLSTLHTNSAPETVTRLLDMGMDPFNFADSLLAVLAQRLVKRLCPHCRKAEPMSEAQLQELLEDYLHVFPKDQRGDRGTLQAEWQAQYGDKGQLQHYHSPGCAKCDHTGYKGRAGLHELLTVSKDVRRLIQTGARAEEIQQCALSEGMRTLRQDGIIKVLSGISTLAEVRSTSNA